MIRFYYLQTPDEGGDLVEFTERVNLDNENVHVTTQAEQGGIGVNSFVVDDVDGTFSISGHRKILIFEDDAPAENQLIFWGYTANRKYGRGNGPKVGAARKITVNVTDINTIIARKVMAGNDTDRPEETDNERMDWLLGTAEAGVEFDDVTTFVPGGSPKNMSDTNYNGQQLNAIIDDCAQDSAKNYYMRWIWDDGAADYVAAFWYGKDTENLAISSLRISNVIEDVDNSTTWFASDDAELDRDPSRVFSGVFGNYDGGWVYRTRAATVTEFANRDTISSWPNVRRQARAEARADRYLATLHTEEDTINVSILVPPANVNDAHAGDAIDARFTHMPGYGEFRACRILARTVTFVTPEVYRIDYVLTPSQVSIPTDMLVAVINVGGPGTLNEPSDLSDHTWTKAFWTGNYAYASQFPGPGGPGSMGIWYRRVVPGESADVITVGGQSSQLTSVWVYHVTGTTGEGVEEAHGIDVKTMTPYDITSPSAGEDSVWIGAHMLQKVSYGQYTMMHIVDGTELANTNGSNATPVYTVDDGTPPAVFIAYETGTGALNVSSEEDVLTWWTGATPNYNAFGRGFGGVLLPLASTFSVVQEEMAYAVSADVTVTLPAPP